MLVVNIRRPLLARGHQAVELEVPVVNVLSVTSLYPLMSVLVFLVPFSPVARLIGGPRDSHFTLAGPCSLSPGRPQTPPDVPQTPRDAFGRLPDH